MELTIQDLKNMSEIQSWFQPLHGVISMKKVQNEIKIRSNCLGTLLVSTHGRVDTRMVVPGDLVTIRMDADTPQFHIYFRKK